MAIWPIGQALISMVIMIYTGHEHMIWQINRLKHVG